MDGPSLLKSLVAFYKRHPNREYAFEKCAAAIFRLMEANVISIDLTRPWRDGGRDALERYRIGNSSGAITVDFSLEAKCRNPSPTNSFWIKDISRLISRMRHRQFGVFVTTSCIGGQAYQEIIEDGHPVVVIAGVDIVTVLRSHGIDSEVALTL